MNKKQLAIIIGSIAVAVVALVTGLLVYFSRDNDENKTDPIGYSFTVEYEDETPVADVTVSVTLSGNEVAARTTDAEGKVNFSLLPNAYTVIVKNAPDGYIANPVVTDENGTHKTITLFKDELKEGQLRYVVSVMSPGETFGLQDVTVNLFQTDGTTLVRTKQTDENGQASFNLDPAQYIVKIANAPAGYTPDKESALADINATPIKFTLTPSLITTPAPAKTRYTLGSVMHDFSVTLSGGDGTFTLSEVLKEKKMVLINLWYIGCGPCAQEFPGLNAAYLKYQEDVEVIALETQGNSLEDIETYKNTATYGCPDLPMAQDSVGFSTGKFSISGVPTSIVVDRNGVICYIHTGNMAQRAFENIFDQYIGDDYLTTVVPDKDGDNSSDVEQELVVPTTIFPGNAAIQAVASASGFETAFTYGETENENDKAYSWPWTITTSEEGDEVFGPSNTGIDNSYSILTVKFTAQKGEALAFDYWLQVETGYDYLYVQVDGVVMYEISLNFTESSYAQAWPTCYAYVAPEEGEYTLELTFVKDAGDGMGVGRDVIYLKNMRFVEESVYNALDEENSFKIKRYAATKANANATGNTPRYNEYVDVYFAEPAWGGDGYYHVGTAPATTGDGANKQYATNADFGPLLLADLMYTTPWNSEWSLWNYALAGYLVYGNTNYQADLEHYAWRQNNSDVLACPVDYELGRILKTIMRDVLANYYENKWLEVCVYYNYYGQAEEIDPIRGIDFASAIKVENAPDYTVVEKGVNGGEYDGFYFTAEVPKLLVPRGFNYEFKVETTGVYEITSLGYKDTIGWLARYDADKGGVIFDESNDVTFTPATSGGFTDPLASGSPDTGASGSVEATTLFNFTMRARLTAGETYYILCAFEDINKVGDSFRVRVSFLGETYSYFATAASSMYSYGTTTNANGQTVTAYYVPDAIDIELGADGYYHPKGDDGYIYVDMLHTTYFASNNTLKLVLEDTKYKLFDFTNYKDLNGNLIGVNYTAKMNEYLAQVETDTTKNTYGCVKLNKELYDILLLYCERAVSTFGGCQTEDNVLQMCYYFREV